VRFGGWSATEAGAWHQWQPSDTVLTGIGAAEPVETLHGATFDDSAEPEAASYTPIEMPEGRAYTGTARQYMGYDARAALALETMRRLPDADADDAQPEQFKSVNLTDLQIAPSAPKPRTSSDKPRAIDRYLVELAGMSESELAGELKKHTATLKKHSGAMWLAGVRDRLKLVEHEIDTRELHGVGSERAPSHVPARRLPPAELAAAAPINQRLFAESEDVWQPRVGIQKPSMNAPKGIRSARPGSALSGKGYKKANVFPLF